MGKHALAAIVVTAALALSIGHTSASDGLLLEARDSQDWLVEVYQELHRCPELLYGLTDTSFAVRKHLQSLGISYRYPVAKSGIVATLGSGRGSTVALRSDMDALPIEEASDKTIRSENAGKMHACGHDSHMTMLLGAAKLLKVSAAADLIHAKLLLEHHTGSFLRWSARLK
mmetsp:Transcript_24805/g.69100  ORF Transcript_24805/g.69100 Transcript_24805/m.69100 type:complete len:172 (+) Transcript_24805:192-707(+)